jgi:hypothetical protein
MRREVLTTQERALVTIGVAWDLWPSLPWYTRLWRRLTGRSPL